MMSTRISMWPSSLAPRSRWLALAMLAILSGAPRPVPGQVDDKLQVQIDRAIREGRVALLEELKKVVERPPGNYPMGRVALPLTAVLRAGILPDHPTVQSAFARLEKMPLERTYSVACYLFALDAYWRAKRGKLGGLVGKTMVASDAATGELRDKIVQAVRWLVEARAEGRGYWSYGPERPGSGRHDFSNTQFAVLGLQIGLEHRVPIPGEVFEEIARRFVDSKTHEGPLREIRITRSSRTEAILEGKSSGGGGRTRPVGSGDHATEVARLRPAGWSYTQSRDDPYASMTAAGASSLQVAINGLGQSGSRLRLEAQKALFSAYGWIADHFNSYVRGTRHYYYTLYSLEKVGDLGEVETFEDHHWYSEGARELVERQRSDGSWGDYVDTSFALLFLTRATRLKPGAPTILTRSQGQDGSSGLRSDFVYISRIDGFVSAKEVLELIGTARRRSLVPVGREVLENYALDARGDLVPPLLAIWTDRFDSTSRFARDALDEITGIRSRDREDYSAWYRVYEKISSLRKESEVDASAVAKILRSTDNLALKSFVLDLVQRRGLREIVGTLIEELSVPDDAYRRRVHGLLTLWTARMETAPEDDDPSRWEEVARRWREWWSSNKTEFLRRREAQRLVDQLEAITRSGLIVRGGATEKKVWKLVDELAKLGEAAGTEIRRRLRDGEHTFYLVEALERITGESLGLRVP